MFDKFGEFNSFSEINELAENLVKEGDLKSLGEMAEENGISGDYVSMFVDGDIPYLCDAMTAALGKIDVESKELKPAEIMADWVEYVKAQCMEDEIFAGYVRKQGKTLKGCIGAILAWAFKHQTPVDKEIITAAGVKAGRVTLGEPGMGQAKKLIRAYYTGK